MSSVAARAAESEAFREHEDIDPHPKLQQKIGRTKGGMDTKLHAVADTKGRPLSFFMTAGQVRDCTGASALLDDLPEAQWDPRPRLLGRLVQLCSSGKRHYTLHSGRKSPVMPTAYDRRRYRDRSRIEIMFGRLKDWLRLATLHDRCPTVFFSAIALAVTVILWL
jgi:transposase